MTEPLDDNQQSIVEKAVQQFVDAQLRGQKPDIDEFVKKYPGLDHQIRENIRDLQKIDGLFDTILQADMSDFEDTAAGLDLVGRTIGSFEVVEMIGRGGMGVVYLAKDTRLDRLVAIKTMPAYLLEDEVAQARFRREARLLAALNHANIAVIYDIIEQDDGPCYLILEYVPGQTLAKCIAESPLPLKEALGTGLKIAEALMAAYEKGIIHRDLKPGNVKITPTGEVKVLDFGIAKALDPTNKIQEASVTQAGHLVGTPAYMSPEQMRSKLVDHRTDNWAFGCVLYEMLTGQLAFEGETISDTIAFVLQREPDWAELPADLPANIRVLLRRCLEKDASDRLQHIGDAAVEIRETLNPPNVAPPHGMKRAPDSRSIHWRTVVASCAFGFLLGSLILAAVFYGYFGRSTVRNPDRPLQRMVIRLPDNQTIAPARMMPLGLPQPTLAISADGSCLVYAAAVDDTMQLYLRSFDELVPRPIDGTEGGCSPFFSPDGQSIGFFAAGKLRTVSLHGGQPMSLCDAGQHKGACWGADGMIYFAHAEGHRLSRVPATGGSQELVTIRTEPLAHERFACGHPQMLPDGKHLLLSSKTSVHIFSLANRDRKLLIPQGQHARYLPTGHIIYAWAGAIQAVVFDPKSCRLTGSPITILDGVLLDSHVGTTQMSVSNDGTLVYVPGGVNNLRSIPVWINPATGQTEPLGLPAAVYGMFKVSPDGQWLCLERADGTQNDIYIWDLTENRLTRLTRQGYSRLPIWTPDGERVVFAHNTEPRNIAWQPIEGAGDVELLYANGRSATPYSWSADSNSLIFTDYDPTTGQDIWILPLEKGAEPTPLVSTPATEWGPALSPDGRWIAYVSDRDGHYRVYVQPYPAMDTLWPVSDGSGLEPIWSPQGDKLYYRASDKWMAVSITTEPAFVAGVPRLIFEGPYLNVAGYSYDISPDGKRFVVLQPEHYDSKVREIHVVNNWFEELKQLAPSPEDR